MPCAMADGERTAAKVLTSSAHVAVNVFILKGREKIASVFMALLCAVFAQTPALAPKDLLATPRIDQRQVNQQKRIDQGVASGQLSARKINQFDKREARIAADEARAKPDGKAMQAERRHLLHEANHARKAIDRQKTTVRRLRHPSRQN